MDADDETIGDTDDAGQDEAYILSDNFATEKALVDYISYLWDNGVEDVYVNNVLYEHPPGGAGDDTYHVFEDSLPIVEDLDSKVGGIDTAIIHIASYTLEDTACRDSRGSRMVLTSMSRSPATTRTTPSRAAE